MSVQTWTWIIVGVTFLLYFGIAFWSRVGSTKDFYVAGGGVSPLSNGMATAADWMSAASFISDGTCLIPNAVSLTIGGIAKITVAIIPGGLPTEKNATAGIK